MFNSDGKILLHKIRHGTTTFKEGFQRHCVVLVVCSGWADKTYGAKEALVKKEKKERKAKWRHFSIGLEVASPLQNH